MFVSYPLRSFMFADKLYVQLSLLRVITGGMQIQFDDYTASFLAKKLLRFITAIKSLAQAGSNFNKNCLLTIGNVMLSVDEVKFGYLLQLPQDHSNITILAKIGSKAFEFIVGPVRPHRF